MEHGTVALQLGGTAFALLRLLAATASHGVGIMDLGDGVVKAPAIFRGKAVEESASFIDQFEELGCGTQAFEQRAVFVIQGSQDPPAQ